MKDTPLTDDYVAELLKKDATRNQNRYLSNSLGGLLSRPKGNAPKPNTRFLRTIVRDADTHNAALRKKEEEESKARLKDLRRGEQSKTETQREQDGESRRRKEGLSPRERHHRKTERSRDRERDQKRRRSRSRSPQRERKHWDRSKEREHRHRDRSREREHSHRPHDKKLGRRHREERKERSRSRSAVSNPRKSRRRSPSPTSNSASDSDPLQDAIGPKPPPTTLPRGRGAYKDSSAMDSRFDPNYDPKLDVGLEEERHGDDWDMALEALRDRAKWRKSGAERLQAAGFTEEEVANFEQGGGGKRGGEDGDISKVKWSKRGEGREWDRGKVLDGDHVDLKPEWDRLKDA